MTTKSKAEINRDVFDIVVEYLVQRKYDGLHNEDVGCACALAYEITACGELRGECIPGHMQPCDCGEHDFHIGEEKPPPVEPGPRSEKR